MPSQRVMIALATVGAHSFWRVLLTSSLQLSKDLMYNLKREQVRESSKHEIQCAKRAKRLKRSGLVRLEPGFPALGQFYVTWDRVVQVTFL